MFMAPAIALYASPPSSVCSSTYQINAHASCDFDLNAKSSASTSPSTSHKPTVGGLSCLFSSPSSVKCSSGSSFGEELASFRHDKVDELKELSSSFGYSPSKFAGSFKRDHHHSPVSVLQGPVSCSANGSSMSPSMRILQNSTGLFNGFVRSALSSSCIDYELATFETDGGVAVVDTEDLTFSFEVNVEDHNPESYADELLVNAQLRHEIFYDEFVIKAFQEAEKAHRGQRRASGDPYLKHCVETAASLALIGVNSTMVAAGLLHDTLDDSSMSFAHLQRTFGADVANLVKGVSKLSELSHLARENNTASKTAEADCLHTMFLGMADVRAVIIKLADRLHNMSTLDALPFIKQQRFAKETLEIFVPLANRLGITNWKEQLENFCFKHLNPENHDEISLKLLDSYDEAMMTSAKEKLEQALEDESISYCLSGRHKSLYSIHRKMLKKKLTLDEIHDIHGLRLIVDNEEDCYKVLRVVNTLWSEVPGKFKDYIERPKCNGYRSLHAVVVGEGTAPLEVQIRTTEMHLQAEFGLAAHWRYKEGDCTYSSFVLRMVEWARWVVSWQCEAMSRETPSLSFGSHLNKSCTFPNHSEDCPFSYKPKLERSGPIFVIVIENDKMSVQELPANSTVKDLMDRKGLGSSRWGSPHGLYSKHELRPRLNHEPVAHTGCKLEMGDVVELTPALPKEWLTEYRERIQRMYDRGLTVGISAPVTGGGGWRN